MHRTVNTGTGAGTATAVLLALLASAPHAIAGAATATESKTKEIPITTSSEEARKLYLEGRDLIEKLRATDARVKLEAAVAKDPGFALGYVGLANSAQTNREFFEGVGKAKALADKVSPGEKEMILGLDAGARGKPPEQRKHYEALVAAFPDDARAHMLLGAHHFGQQEWDKAIAEYTAATRIDPKFTPPYNQLGYAHRFVGRYDEAEKAFKRYIELIPGDPNPLDSYAELLMKMGRFEDSIKSYEKALAIDPNFVASYVGIANDEISLGRGEAARQTLAKLGKRARNPGERRQAMFWTAVSWVHEGSTEKALEEMAKERAVADEIGDKGSAAQDLNVMGNILLAAGSPEKAEARFDESLATLEKADVPADVKEAGRRQRVYLGALAALARKDLEAARTRAESYGKLVAAKGTLAETRQQHEIAGRLALLDKDYARAVSELKQANDQDPRVLHHLGMALDAKGDREAAREALRKAAEWNALNLNFAFVRQEAKAKLTQLAAVRAGG